MKLKVKCVLCFGVMAFFFFKKNLRAALIVVFSLEG